MLAAAAAVVRSSSYRGERVCVECERDRQWFLVTGELDTRL